MSGEPLVTVVIPTYNRRYCLGRAIDSVLKQDCGPVELIVVDDASPDGTADWVAANYPGVRLIRHPVNRRVSASRNSGLAAARARFIAFLDDDDWWDASFLRRHLDLLRSRPDAVLSYCDFVSVAEDEGSPVTRISGELGDDPVETFLMENPIRSLTLLVMSRRALAEAGGFREDYAMCEDRELYLRLLPRGAFLHAPGLLAFKTRSSNSMTIDLPVWSQWAQTLLDEFFSREDSRAYRHLERKARALWQTRLAIKGLRQTGQRLLGLRLAVSALRHDARESARYVADRVIKRS